MGTPTRRIDSRVTVTTPEGAELTLAAAGPVPRGIAWAIDLVIRLTLFVLVSIVLGILGIGGDSFVPFLVLFGIFWLYFTLFEGLTGATPGKRSIGLMVVQRDGSACGLEASFVRNLLRAVDSLPFFYAVGLTSVLASGGSQRLGDHAAGTLVVYADPSERRRARAARKPRRARREPAAGLRPKRRDRLTPLPPTIALTGEEEAAVLAFARREEHWGRERGEELAAHAVQLTGARTHEEGRVRLLRIARWLQEQGT